MTEKRESGIASAVAVLLLLAVLLVCAGVWTAAVLPAEQHREAEKEAAEAQVILTDTVFSLRKTAESGLVGVSISLAFPKGTLTTEDAGYLAVNGTNRIYLQTLSHETGVITQGICAGGVWRRDGEDAAWILLPKTMYRNGVLSLELPTLIGETAQGSSSLIPVSFCYEGTHTKTFSGTVSLTVATEEQWMQDLWHTYFTETAYQYADVVDVTISSSEHQITAGFTPKTGDFVLQVKESVHAVSGGQR